MSWTQTSAKTATGNQFITRDADVAVGREGEDVASMRKRDPILAGYEPVSPLVSLQHREIKSSRSLAQRPKLGHITPTSAPQADS